MALPTSVDDFTFTSFDAVYELRRGEDGRAQLRTTETLVAEFPETDQNRGIRRAIPSRYDGHSTRLEVESVTDETGTPRRFEVDESDGEFDVVTIRADTFVHGEQTYVITYTQHDVVFYPDDAAIQEFYWDVNGTGWAQPFGSVTARLELDPELGARLTGAFECYQGGAGATTACDDISQTESASGTTITANANNIGPFENLTIAVGFEPGTFEPFDTSLTGSFAGIASLAAAAGAVVTAIAAIVLRRTAWRSHPGRGIIVPEYSPPKGVPLLESADALGTSKSSITALILDLAVAGDVRIVETKRKRYALELVRRGRQGADDRALLDALFPRGAAGARRDLRRTDAALSRRLRALGRAVRKRMLTVGYRRSVSMSARAAFILGSIVLAVVGFFASVTALDSGIGSFWPGLFLVVCVLSGLTVVILTSDVRPLTERGAALRDHMRGLKRYIQLAEGERMRVLQSPEGALRVNPAAAPAFAAGAATPAPVDDAEVLKLHEKLLPYAVLIGEEKRWLGELGRLYEDNRTEPDWYIGVGAFNAGVFAAGVSGFSAASNASWSSSASSSSSSGSGGGGSSGGGGGGGGGGGV